MSNSISKKEEVVVAGWLRRRSSRGSTPTPWEKMTHQAQRQWLQEARELLMLVDAARETP